MDMLWKILAVLGPTLMLIGYFQRVFALEIDQFTWIAVGNICLLIGYLIFLKEERKKWTKQFLVVNPEWRDREHLWVSYRLLAEGHIYLYKSGLHGEKLEDWHARVCAALENWSPEYKKYYLLNDKPDLGYRVRYLEQTLDWILC